jgi:hypothetical protein
MSQADYTKAFEALPRPLPGPAPPGLSIHEAIQARNTIDIYCIYAYHADIISFFVYTDIIPDFIPDFVYADNLRPLPLV